MLKVFGVKVFRVSLPCVRDLSVWSHLHITNAISLSVLCELHATTATEECQETDDQDDFCGDGDMEKFEERLNFMTQMGNDMPFR